MNSKIKHFIFAFLMILASVFLWYCLFLFFFSVSLSHLFYLVVSWLVFLIFFLLFCLLIENRNLVHLTFIVSAACFFLFFFTGEEMVIGPYAVGVLVFLLFLVIAAELMSKEKEQRLKVCIKKVWRRGLPLVVTALSLIIALVYYFNPLLKIGQEKIEIPSEVFGFILKPASGIVGKMIPFYDPEMTIDQTLTTGLTLQGKQETQDIPADLLNKIDFNNLEDLDVNALLQNPEVKDFLKEQVSQGEIDKELLAEQRKQLSQSLGVEIKGDETMEVVVANLVNSKIDEFIGPWAKEISLGIAIALFFVLKLVGNLFGLLAMILSRLLFSVLLLFKVVRIEQEMRPGEVIKY